MDNLTIMLAALLASLQPLPHQPPASPPPVAAQAVKKPQAPSPPAKAEHACPGYGYPDAQGNLNYCLNN